MALGKLRRASVAELRRAAAAGEVEVVASLWNLIETAKCRGRLAEEGRNAKLRVADAMDACGVRRLLRPQNILLASSTARKFAGLTGRRCTVESAFFTLNVTVREYVEELVDRRSAERPASLWDLAGLRRDGPHAASLPMLFGEFKAAVERARLSRGSLYMRVIVGALDPLLGALPAAAGRYVVASYVCAELQGRVDPPPRTLEVFRLLDQLQEAPLTRVLNTYGQMVRSDRKRNPDKNDVIDSGHALAANFVDVLVHEGFAANQLKKTARALGLPVRVFSLREFDAAVSAACVRLAG